MRVSPLVSAIRTASARNSSVRFSPIVSLLCCSKCYQRSGIKPRQVQFTGRPVSGILAGQEIELKQRPIVIDTWERWRTANPGTKILSLNTGHKRDYGSGVVYNSYFASDDLMFPVTVEPGTLSQKEYVFGMRQFGGAKAWPIEAFRDNPVINDELLGRPLVLIGDPETRSVRAYERGRMLFSGEADTLRSDDGTLWRMRENALISANGQSLSRVAGHVAYWFAWNSYLAADSELYER